MSPALKDKVAVITGGGRGLGKAFAVECASRGWNLTLTDHKFRSDDSVERATLEEIEMQYMYNDGDTYLIGQVASAFPHVILHGALAQLELGGLKVAANHYPEIGRGLARSGDYGLVCYGHDHAPLEERVGECLLLNPGELMGMKGRSTMAEVDTDGRKVRWIDL